jgi:hypothetical protein
MGLTESSEMPRYSLHAKEPKVFDEFENIDADEASTKPPNRRDRNDIISAADWNALGIFAVVQMSGAQSDTICPFSSFLNRSPLLT